VSSRTTTLAVKVPIDVAAAVRTVAERCDETVSDLLRVYVVAIAAGRRWQLVDEEDELVGYAFRLTDD
jgi:hypothetical protein